MRHHRSRDELHSRGADRGLRSGDEGGYAFKVCLNYHVAVFVASHSVVLGDMGEG